jgi:hemolysin III
MMGRSAPSCSFYSRAPARPYYPGEFEADCVVHLIGTVAGAVGAPVLLVLAAKSAETRVLCSVLAYSVGLVAMLGCSAAYHLRRIRKRRDLLRRLDHAAIFVMIAGTYTPFTACVLGGSSAIWLTGAVWLAALGGAGVKLACPRRYEWGSTAVYVVMGWAVIVFMQPLLAALDRPILVLLLSGGGLYTIGACIHRWRRLPYHDAIWHSSVLGAAGLHYAAVLYGIVLSAPPA